MKVGPIDASRIEAMAARLQAAASRATLAMPAADSQGAPASPLRGLMRDAAAGAGAARTAARADAGHLAGAGGASRVSFSDALREMLDSVNDQQSKADDLSKRFALGDDSVNLSDVMIERQKASLSLQATVQVRNKLVSAYHEIMNMQV